MFRPIFALMMSLFLIIPAAQAERAPRVAVWNPEHGTAEPRLKIDPAEAGRLAKWFDEGGTQATLLTADQIADTSTFSAALFDAIAIQGNAIPANSLDAIRSFAEEGGVVVGLGAPVPFLIKAAPNAKGEWALSPSEPKFAWQTDELLKTFGLRDVYDEPRFDQGVWHPSTPLFKRYLPNAADVRGKLPSRWVVPLEDASQAGTIYPLIRSERRDISAVPPQVYVARRGKATAIVTVDPMYTSDSRPDVWPSGKETVAAIARLAKDLRDGKVELTNADATKIDSSLPPQPTRPLDRTATGSVEPEGATPLARWGKFDGSCDEFGAAIEAGKHIDVTTTEAKAFPSALDAGASVTAAVPVLVDGPLYLRIRGAYLESGTGLKVMLGDETVFNERLLYVDASSPGNFSRGLIGLPVEFTRVIYLPPSVRGAKTVTLSNPGTATLTFDAVQIERRTKPEPARIVGVHDGDMLARIKGRSAPFTEARMSMRTNFLGEPGDPNRFDKMAELFDRVAKGGVPIQGILEGTPPWAAISPERLKEAQAANRPHTVPPDPEKYAQIVRDVIGRFGNQISTYEIWNEPDIQQFYRGSASEYAQLCKTIIPIIRSLEPNKPIMLSGMAGYHENFLREMHSQGVMDMVDLLAFHPYSGRAAAWDMPYGLVEGTLMSWGVDKEIHCNESGFPWRSAEWFTTPQSPVSQRRNLNIAISRLLSGPMSKVNVFKLSGGNDGPYDLLDRDARPRPAFAVYADYGALGAAGSRRLDVTLTSADGEPLEGVFVAGATHADGAATVVVNPSQHPQLSPPEPEAPANPTPALTPDAKWVVFNGDAKYAGNGVTLSPAAGQPSAGFYKHATFDPKAYPTLRVIAAGDSADWRFMLKRKDGSVVLEEPRRTAGSFAIDLSSAGPGEQELELSFRAFGPTNLAKVQLEPAKAEVKPPAVQPAVTPVPVVLRLPLTGNATAWEASIAINGKAAPAEVVVQTSNGERWAELNLALTARFVVRVSPQR